MVGGWPSFGRAVSLFFAPTIILVSLQGMGQRDLDPCCILGREHGAPESPSMLPSMPGSCSISATSAPACGETLLGAMRCEQRGPAHLWFGAALPARGRTTHVPVFRPALAPSFRNRTSVSGALLIGTWNHAPLDRVIGERAAGSGAEHAERRKGNSTFRSTEPAKASADFDSLRGT